ncbi:hypothetical protein [Pseudomonas lactis]|uniref:hypothetical protein n=1 Tax=Pseudomonas lactis TaxID=1615674 RepID=UPI0013DEFEF7|nr:hypothetical protein [Pseudomonas lactis]
MEDFKGWATLVGALVAGCTGLFNTAIQVRGKRDVFTISPYSTFPDPDQREFMHVVSLSDHPIQLMDWGWIDDDESLSSIRRESCEPDFGSQRSDFQSPSKLESRNAVFQTGYLRKKTPIGAYACSATQRKPKLSFKHGVSAFKKTKIHIRVWWMGAAYLS